MNILKKHPIIHNLLKTLLILIGASLICALLVKFFKTYTTVAMVYLLAVVIISRYTSLYIWGTLASFLSIFMINYFFTFPYFTLNFSMDGYPATFIAMLWISFITSTLTSRYKEQMNLAQKNEQNTTALYQFNKKLLMIDDHDTLIKVTVDFLESISGHPVIFAEPDQTTQTRIFSKQPMIDNEGVHFPVLYNNQLLGSICLKNPSPKEVTTEDITFLNLALAQVSLAMERQRLSSEQQTIMLQSEKEKMRSNLLRAISHDLRTPLTCILGSCDTLKTQNDSLTPYQKTQLLENISNDSNWLIHMVENLLTVTRITNGETQLSTSYEAVEEIISEVISRVKSHYPEVAFDVLVPGDFLMVPMDATLIEQVLLNLIENAILHANSTGNLKICVQKDSPNALFEISDNGTGIDENAVNALFDNQTSDYVNRSDASRGMGIGLSICKTIINAHHGSIWAKNHTPPQTGASFIFTLPLED